MSMSNVLFIFLNSVSLHRQIVIFLPMTNELTCTLFVLTLSLPLPPSSTLLHFPIFSLPLLRLPPPQQPNPTLLSLPPHPASFLSIISLPPPALKDDRFQMVLFTPRLVRITLTNVSVWDEGGYFCQLYTDATHHQVATLSVSVPPETPTVEVKQEAVEGGEVELTCVSPRSKPAATLRWIRNGREIPGNWTWLIDGLMDG